MAKPGMLVNTRRFTGKPVLLSSVIQVRWNGAFIYTWRRQKIKYVKVDPSKLQMIKIDDGIWPKIKGYTPPVAGNQQDQSKND